jgi:hypothetical protein
MARQFTALWRTRGELDLNALYNLYGKTVIVTAAVLCFAPNAASYITGQS